MYREEDIIEMFELLFSRPRFFKPQSCDSSFDFYLEVAKICLKNGRKRLAGEFAEKSIRDIIFTDPPALF